MVELEPGTRQDRTIEWEDGPVTLSSRTYGFRARIGSLQIIAGYASPAQVTLAGGVMVKIRDHVMIARLAALALLILATMWRFGNGNE